MDRSINLLRIGDDAVEGTLGVDIATVSIGGSALVLTIDAMPSHGVESAVSSIATDDGENEEKEEANHGGGRPSSFDELFSG